jgi:hypothetical protein
MCFPDAGAGGCDDRLGGLLKGSVGDVLDPNVASLVPAVPRMASRFYCDLPGRG